MPLLFIVITGLDPVIPARSPDGPACCLDARVNPGHDE
jgi:hypothetical protein